MPQTAVTLKGFWRLLLGTDDGCGGCAAAARSLKAADTYSTRAMSPSKNLSETAGHELQCFKTMLLDYFPPRLPLASWAPRGPQGCLLGASWVFPRVPFGDS